MWGENWEIFLTNVELVDENAFVTIFFFVIRYFVVSCKIENNAKVCWYPIGSRGFIIRDQTNRYMRIKSFKLALKGLALLSIFLAAGCAGSNKRFNRAYAKVWKETIKSEAWKLSLKNNQDTRMAEGLDFYASSEVVVVDDKLKHATAKNFDQKYSKLVSKAYFKIIAEAEKSDDRLRKEYELLHEGNTDIDAASKGKNGAKLSIAIKRYKAHKQMLEGLKSWNIMSDYGSDDLDFFQQEHKSHVERMFGNGQSEDAIVNYLVYKLADLYHFDQ